MIINGSGHWSWLVYEISISYPELFRIYNFNPTPDGFMLCRKLFNKNAEVIILQRTSEKCYKLSMYRGSEIQFTSFRKAIDIVEYLREKIGENPFNK